MRAMHFRYFIAVVSCAIGAISASFATCSSFQHYSSVSSPRGVTYVKTPGLCDRGTFDGGVGCESGSGSITGAFRGSFWAIGLGDPRIGPGFDDGGAPAVSGTGPDLVDGWVVHYGGYNYAAWIDGIWNPNNDPGCGGPFQNECMAFLLNDETEGNGYFALVTAAYAIHDVGETWRALYDIAQPGGADIRLAPLPDTAGRSRLLAPYVVDVKPPRIPREALYLDQHDDCRAVDGPIGYRVYVQAVDAGAPAPASRRPENGWTVAEGSSTKDGGPLPLGRDATITLPCPVRQADFYLATGLEFDSGFRSILGRNSRPFRVNPTTDCTRP